MWPKREKTEEKRKIEFQKERKKKKKVWTSIVLDPSTQDGEMGLLQSCETEKKKRRKREGKRKEKEERGENKREKTEIPASQDCWDRRSKAHVEGTWRNPNSPCVGL